MPNGHRSTHPSALPKDVAAYSKTPVYDDASLPAGLRDRHSLRSGSWARLHILEGSIRFVFLEPDPETVELAQGDVLVVPPELPHQVELTGPVRLFLEFYR